MESMNVRVKKGGTIIASSDPSINKPVVTNKGVKQDTNKPTATFTKTENTKPVNAPTESKKPVTTGIVASMAGAIEGIKETIKNPNDIVGKNALAVKTGGITPILAATSIIAELRAIYFTSIDLKPLNTYDLDTLNYLDKILFDPLTKMVEHIIVYNSQRIPVELCLGLVKSAVDSLELQVNIEAMYDIIYRIYEEF